MLAQNFNEFVEVFTEAERKALNTPQGQELTFLLYLFRFL